MSEYGARRGTGWQLPRGCSKACASGHREISPKISPKLGGAGSPAVAARWMRHASRPGRGAL